MKNAIRWCVMSAVATSIGLSSVGCQTYQVGQVLPSPHHMRDDVQYFPKGPQFPLSKELNSMQAADDEYERGRR